MPNWATVEYRLVGRKEDVEQAKKELDIINSLPPPDQSLLASGLWHLNAFIYPEHYKLEDLTPYPDTALPYMPLDDARESIQDVTEPVQLSSGDWYVEFFTEAAWGAHFEIVHYYAKSRNLILNYYCEEPGNCCYELCNPNNVFHDDEFIVNDCAGPIIISFRYDELFDEDTPAFIETIADGKFYAWLKENNKELTKENLIPLSEEYTNSLSEDDRDAYDIYIYKIQRTDSLIEQLPAEIPAYNPPTEQ